MEHDNNGQHADMPGVPMDSQGQRTVVPSGTRVGQRNGPELNMTVPATRKDADISSTSGSAGPLSQGERPGADDQR